jgi:beta-glucanase (GH16 family)
MLRRGIVLALAAVLLCAPAATAARPASALPVGNLPGWRQVLVDDFEHGLNRSHWGVYDGQPDGDPGGWWDPSHVFVRDGLLHLDSSQDPRFGGRWVSGGLSSSPWLKQRYGKYLVRFRMDAGMGISAVLLLWPVANVWPPEIDFAENGGDTLARTELDATLHFGADDSQIERKRSVDWTAWHTAGVEWTPGKLVYTLDGRRWAVVRSREVPAQAMELDIQSQAGTCGDVYRPCPDSSTPPHVDLQVDWVVAYAYAPRR